MLSKPVEAKLAENQLKLKNTNVSFVAWRTPFIFCQAIQWILFYRMVRELSERLCKFARGLVTVTVTATVFFCCCCCCICFSWKQSLFYIYGENGLCVMALTLRDQVNHVYVMGFFSSLHSFEIALHPIYCVRIPQFIHLLKHLPNLVGHNHR